MFNLQLQFDRIDDFNTVNTNLFIIQNMRKNAILFFSLDENAITFI